ncbi:TPA: hypothetical protein ACXGFD_003947 [Enterobacter cloacae]
MSSKYEDLIKNARINADCGEHMSPAEVTTLLNVVEATFAALAAENAGLKAGIGFFSYDSSGCYEEHETAEKAAAYAEDSISEYRDNAPDGWSDEVGSVVWGVIMQRATMTGLRPVTEEDNVAPHIEEFCDYTLLPNIETPVTDAFLAEVRASAVDEACLKISNAIVNCYQDEQIGLDAAATICGDFSSEIRKGVLS